MSAFVEVSIVALVVLIAPITLYWFMRHAEWKFTPTKHEVGLTPTATFRTAARSVDITASWPLVRVSTYPGLVVIALRSSEFLVLRDSDAVRIEGGRSFLSRSRYLKFVRTRAVAPVPILVWPRPHQHDAFEAAVRASLAARVD